jgi:DNA-binding NtrC family response regulator
MVAAAASPRMPRPGVVLVIDDEPGVLAALQRAIRREPDLHVRVSADPRAALEQIAQDRPDVVLTDLAMPGLDGLTVLRRVKALDPTVEVLVMTAYGSVDAAVEALRAGAFDFLTKPFDSVDRVITRVRGAVARRQLQTRLHELESARDERFARGGIVGRSAAIEEVVGTVRDISASCINVLVRGESGTGKEIVARAIHQNSPRRHKPLVAVNCSALVETLLESELFGHVRGAFTGATANKRGLFEEAHEGTIFLDEIGELSPQMQAKLLRVLQSGEFKRIGENAIRTADVRVIAATNRDLETAIAAGNFREDLYYRLNVITVTLPPLRDRREDIPVLVESFLTRFAAQQHKSFESIEPAFVDALLAHDWPGNVRELENVVQRAVVLERTPTLTAQALPPLLRRAYESRRAPIVTAPPGDGDGSAWWRSLPERYHDARDLALAAFHKAYLENLLERTGGNISEAARVSGVERSNLKRMLKRVDVSAATFRDGDYGDGDGDGDEAAGAGAGAFPA